MDTVERLLDVARTSAAKTNYEQALEALFKADALLPPQDTMDRVDSQIVISKTYFVKGSPEQAEQHARRALTIWQSSHDKRTDRLVQAYGLLIESLAAQGKHGEVVRIVSAVAQSPSAAFAKFEDRIVLMLQEGCKSAAALKDNESELTFSKLVVEFSKLAIEQNQNQEEANRLRAHIMLGYQYGLGVRLTVSGNHREAIDVLREAEQEAHRQGNESLRNEALVWLGHALVMGKHPLEGVTTLTNVIERLDDGSKSKCLGLVSLNLGYTMLGERARAEEVSARLLRIAIRTADSGGALAALQRQASDLLQRGRLMEAKDCLENSLRAMERYPDMFDEDRFHNTLLLAIVHTRRWDVKNALQAVQTAERLLPQAVSTASVLDSNLTFAAYFAVMSEFSEMLSWFPDAADKDKNRDAQLKFALAAHSLKLQCLTDEPLLIAESWLDVGRAYVRARDFPNAFAALASAKEEAGKPPHGNSGLESRIFDIFALAYSEQGDSASAIQIREQLLGLLAKKSGKTDPLYFHTLRELANDYLRTRDFQKASEMCLEGQLIFVEHVWRDMTFLPTGQSSGWNLAGILFPRLACVAALSGTNQIAARNAAFVSAMSKGLETEVWTAQAMLSTNQSVGAVRQSIEDFWSNPREKEQSVQANKAYKLRGEISAALQTMLEGSRISINELRNSVPADAVLVDFTHFYRYQSDDKSDPFKEEHYAAYLILPLARDSTNFVVERVDLGEAAPINEAVELVCKRMSAGQFAAKDLSPALQRLGQLVYAPLAPYLTNVSHLIVCPDGQLSRLPFEMLSVGNKFLIEEKTISYVTSGREVVRLAKPLTRRDATVSPSDGERAGRGAVGKSLVMGNPDFDLDLRSSRRESALTQSPQPSTNNPQPEIQSLLTSSPTRVLSRDYRGLKFNPLPGSGIEATNVAKLLGTDAYLRLGADAREAELKAVVSPRVLHLATHGFFLSDQEMNREIRGIRESPFGFPASGPMAESFSRGSRGSRFQDWENPLVRCGIALAGANHARQFTNAVAEDGLLTGLEASLLNLQGTELVILSACDSGTGEVKIGEGVMSLRRAFRIAGAETVLASHWKISDPATARLMTEFMRRWRAGEPRAKAWREAQLALLHSKDFSNPYFWAAFTLTGKWN